MIFSFSFFFWEILLCVALLLVVRHFFGKTIGPVMCRLLWGVLIVRCLIPFSIPTKYAPVVFDSRPKKIEQQISDTKIPANTVKIPYQTETIFIDPFDHDWQNEVTDSAIVSSPAIPTVPSAEPLSASPSTVTIDVWKWILFLFLGIWVAGVLFFLGLALVRNRRMIRLSVRQPVAVPDWVQTIFLECREHLRIGTWPVLIVSKHVTTPCLVGAIRPRILIPGKLVEDSVNDRESMRYVLLHELTHLKQGDIWFSWCWTLMISLHWFNPVLWWVGRFVNFDCEAACDQRVLEHLDNTAKQRNYGHSLLDILKKLNPPFIRYPGLSTVVENATNLERRLTMITHYRKRTFFQVSFGFLLLILLLVVSMTGFAQQKSAPISPEKAKMMGYVEDFFMHNFRDITMKKSLEWGDVTTDKAGNSTIRYKCECLIWDREKIIDCTDFTFDKAGNYVSAEKVEGYPQVIEPKKSDTSTKPRLQKLEASYVLVANEFIRHLAAGEYDKAMEMSEDVFRKAASAKMPEVWGSFIESYGKFQSAENVKVETVLEFKRVHEKCTFETGEVVVMVVVDKDDKVTGFFIAPTDTQEVKQLPAEEKASYVLVADEFIKYLAAGEYDKAMEMSEDIFKKKASAKMPEVWGSFIESYGKFQSAENVKVETVLEFKRVHVKCTFETGVVVVMVVVDKDDKVTGFFIASADAQKAKQSPAEETNYEKLKTLREPVASSSSFERIKIDIKGSQASAGVGWQHFMSGQFAEGEKEFLKAAKLNPKNANAYQGLGWCQSNLGKTDEAKKTFEKCLELDPKNAAALNGLGWITYRADDKDEAIKWWEKAIAADKNATAAISGLANLYVGREDWTNAAKYYKMLVEANPKDEVLKAALKNAEEKVAETK